MLTVNSIAPYLPMVIVVLSGFTMAKKACPGLLLGFLVAALAFVLMFGAAYCAIELHTMYNDNEVPPPTVINQYTLTVDPSEWESDEEEDWETEEEEDWETEEDEEDWEDESGEEEYEDEEVDEDTQEDEEEEEDEENVETY